MINLSLRPLALTAFSALALLGTSLAASAQDITVTHAQGETTLQGVPEKVVVFDYAALDTLRVMGIEVAGVPGSNLPPSLSEYGADTYAKVGSLFEPDYEAVAALEPDLIIVAGRSSAAYPQLAPIAPTVDLSNNWTDFVNSVKANTETLGQIFGKDAEADALIAAYEEVAAPLRAEAGNLGRVMVILTNAGEVTDFGPGSRFGFVFDDLGMTPAVSEVAAETHGDAISFEYILETNPDWLIVIDRDAATGTQGGAAEQVLDNELVAQTTAWQQGHVVYVDPARWYIINGGIANLTEMVTQLSDEMLAD
jgi:iron complex transport system substrate-binding protein